MQRKSKASLGSQNRLLNNTQELPPSSLTYVISGMPLCTAEQCG
jgi:hypothetical protein